MAWAANGIDGKWHRGGNRIDGKWHRRANGIDGKWHGRQMAPMCKWHRRANGTDVQSTKMASTANGINGTTAKAGVDGKWH
jgi:hypothetical protein